MSEPAHDTYGPSTLNYRAQCRGWENRDDGPSDAADEGSLMHRAVETGDTDALDAEQERMVAYARTIVAPLMEKGEVHKELRLNIRLGTGLGIFGTTDLVVVDEGNRTAYVVDYKFGRLAVPEVVDNLQARAYVVGTFQKFDVDQVVCYFIQPRREWVSAHTFYVGETPSLVHSLHTLVAESKNPDAPRTVCKACQYCAKLPGCAEVRGHMLGSINTAGLPIPPPAHTPNDTLTPEQVDSFALPTARIMETWIKQVKARATELLSDGTELDSHELGERSAPVKLERPVNELTPLATVTMGIPLDDILQCCSLSVSQLKKTAKRHGVAEQDFMDQLQSEGFISTDKPKTKYLKRK